MNGIGCEKWKIIGEKKLECIYKWNFMETGYMITNNIRNDCGEMQECV